MLLNKLKSYSFFLILLPTLLFFNCANFSSQDDKKDTIEEELYRPYVHFTPQKNWMNDPNGMFYYNGKYHLYFQYYPDDNVWGPMHWGHASSKDMISWEEHPIALYPDEKGYIFSGSAVVDHNNTSGFGVEGKTPIIAMFTHHSMEKELAEKVDVESQSIAYSLDEGMTWTKYEGNPVIKNPNIRNYRDPKVFWHEDTQKWVMVLAADDQVMLYASPDMKNWEYLSSFGKGIGNHDGVWECPDLMLLPVKNTSEMKYVLLVSNSRNTPNSGSATQYFVGDFDGKEFKMDNAFSSVLEQEQNFWMDFGKDNYAGVRFQNIQGPTGEKYLMGWMSNWEYATKVPTQGWRSSMTLARELSLFAYKDTYRLKSLPVNSLMDYSQEKSKGKDQNIKENTLLQKGALLPSLMDIRFNPPSKGKVVFTLSTTQGDRVEFGYDADQRQYFLDRTNSGEIDFSPTFANAISTAPRFSEKEEINLKVLVDKTSLELFWDDGETTMTEIFFTRQPLNQLSSRSTQEHYQLNTFVLNALLEKPNEK